MKPHPQQDFRRSRSHGFATLPKLARLAIRTICVGVLLSVVTMASFTRGADEDPLKVEVARAEAAYQAETESLKKAILAGLDKREEQARKSANKDWVDLVKEDRRGFDIYQRIPPATPRAIWQQTAKSRSNYANTLSNVAGKYAKTGNDNAATQIENQAKEFLRRMPPINLDQFALLPNADLDTDRFATWRYTMQAPLADWVKPNFNDSGWEIGSAPFGAGKDYPTVRTAWRTKQIWMRRVFELPADKLTRVSIRANHDDFASIFINGIEARTMKGWSENRYRNVLISLPAAKSLKPGLNTIAVTCTNIGFGSFIDVGIIDEPPPGKK